MLTGKTFVAGATLSVGSGTSCNVLSSSIPADGSLSVSGGGELTLSSLTLALDLLSYERGSGTVSDGSTLNLDSITLHTDRDWPSVTGSVTMEDGTYVFSPPNIFAGFTMLSGPCIVTRGGRCVGRPEGYGENEECAITVVHGGPLGPCPVFDTVDYAAFTGCGATRTQSCGNRCPYYEARRDTLMVDSTGEIFSGPQGGGYCPTMPSNPCGQNGQPGHVGCPPNGTVLPQGSTLTWLSGAFGLPSTFQRECIGKPTPWARAEGQSGWEICF